MPSLLIAKPATGHNPETVLPNSNPQNLHPQDPA
jgi:hypothetical protein